MLEIKGVVAQSAFDDVYLIAAKRACRLCKRDAACKALYAPTTVITTVIKFPQDIKVHNLCRVYGPFKALGYCTEDSKIVLI